MKDNIEFGSMVFSDEVMLAMLPKDAYLSLRRSIDQGVKLDSSVASVVANAMKDWAMKNGATHYCHWFMPMTGSTSEKHDAFLNIKGGKPIYEFSGKKLIYGESDASSLPSGGLRATCEARGYTTWDCTSNAFIRDGSLFIPTAFCSYTGEALDKKTPLLRSMDALSNAAVRFLRVLGVDAKRVSGMVGAEQEYFLVDKSAYEKRLDLKFTGRTLIGRSAPKGQELCDHYFGSLKPRVGAFMQDIDSQLWKLGVPAKTKHNEVAPTQHELAPVYTVANIATDTNYLTMDVMRKTAAKYGLVCLLHEKPYKWVSGSGKHNNWSLCTDSGINLLKPGKNPEKNLVFLLTMAAVLSAVDKHSDLLLMSIASRGNELRLGANEAPPSIMSVYLGADMVSMLEGCACGKQEGRAVSMMNSGVSSLVDFAKDTADRNRTSPFAFTGDKFEFRMVGSSASIAGPTTILNAIVASSLADIAAELEGSKDVHADGLKLMSRLLKQHERIIFNGNNYDDEWQKEAKRRGLVSISSAPEALKVLKDRARTAVLEKTGVYTAIELESRYEICLSNYTKTVGIEARTLLDMATLQIMPACYSFMSEQADNLVKLSGLNIKAAALSDRLVEVSELTAKLELAVKKLKSAHEACAGQADAIQADIMHGRVLPAMDEVRQQCDKLEALIPADKWPIPVYADLLFGA